MESFMISTGIFSYRKDQVGASRSMSQSGNSFPGKYNFIAPNYVITRMKHGIMKMLGGSVLDFFNYFLPEFMFYFRRRKTAIFSILCFKCAQKPVITGEGMQPFMFN
jgi:hypothetical protein